MTAVAGAAGGGVDDRPPTSNDAEGAGDGDGAFVAAGVGSGRLGKPDELGELVAAGVLDAPGVANGGGVCACDAVTPNAPTAPAAPIASAMSFVLSFMSHLLRAVWTRTRTPSRVPRWETRAG